MPSPADSPRALDDRSSDVGDAHHEPHQAEQDAHLAASLSQAPRLRSGTVSRNTTEDLPGSTEAGGAGGQQQPSQAAAGPSTQTPVAQRTSSNNVTFGASAGTGSESRRRPSLGHTRSGESASDAMGHLADDLAREDREEEARIAQERQYDREAAAVAAVRARRQQHSHHAHPYHGTPSSMPRSAVAARLYRQQNLSDSSIDSNGGAFIDHRRQQHSLSIGTSPRAAAGPGNSSTRSPELVPIGSSARKGSSGLRRYSSSAGAGDDSLARSPTSPRAFDPAMAPRGYSVSPSEANGPDASGEHDRSRPVHFLERHSSHGSMRSRRSDRSSGSGGHRSRDLPYGVDMSRPGSGLGKPEDDICFPAHGAAAELDFIDMRDVDHPHDSDHHHGHPGDGFADPEGAVPLPGVLPNFPFPFDFTALEDFAEHEREGMPIPNGRRRRAAGDLAQSMSPPTAANEYGVSSPTMTENRYQSHTNFGKHDSESQGGGGGTGMGGGRRRRMSGNQHGRMRRKLALFEGAGDDLDDVSSPPSGGGGARPFNGRGDSDYANLNGTKTPLLADKRGASGYGAAAGPDARKAGGARPYRFSFYSNALPTTVHARSLAELPSDGQSFEELFCGTRHRAEYDGGDEPATQNRPPSAVSLDARLAGLAASTTDQKAGSGTATPASAANTVNNVPSSKLLGTLPAGVSATTMRTDRPKTVVMRSDEDAEANTWWLDVTCPTDQEMKTLSKVFGIHPLTTEDIQMEETREKIELFRNYYFVCFRSFEQDPYSPTYLEPLNMYIIVFREGTLSFHFRGTPHPQNVRRRIKQLKDYINVTSDWISYALIDDITDAFGPLIQNIEYEVDSIDELVLILKEAEQSDMLRRIGTCRKKVMGLLRLMGNKADVVKGLSKRCNENWSVAPKSDIGLYLSDIQDHITTSTQNLTHYEKILSRSHSNYLAQISIEMTDANNQINDVLSKLTALGTVLIPMNLVTGLWGMNVNVPGQDASGLGWFFGILGCLAAFAVVGAFLTYRFFVRSN